MEKRAGKFFPAALYAGIFAGILATIVQILLWWIFWDVLPSILYRDVRFTAAIILGQATLSPPATFNWQIIIIATVIHFSLSMVYSVILSLLISRMNLKASLVVGSLYGLIIFIFNMYGVVIFFPWFVETQDWITVIAHIAFGISAAVAYNVLRRKICTPDSSP